MKRVLVTGGGGFVGSNLTRHLLGAGHDVHLLVRPAYTTWRLETILPDVHLHEVDLADRDGLARVARVVRPDWIFHLAAYGAYATQTRIERMIQTNLVGTINLVEACLPVGFESFVSAGSSSEYGFKDHPPVEDEWVDPNSHYALTKVSATHFCRHTARTLGRRLITLRLYSVYGPYEDPTRLLPTLVVRGLDGALPPLADPAIARDYVHAMDVSEAFVCAASQPAQELGAVYNVGTGIETTLGEVVALARDVMHIGAEPEWGTMLERQWDTSTWVADPNKISAALNWRPRYRFEQGFRAMVDWMAGSQSMREFYRTHRQPPT